jgi:hypothetical protein
MRLGCRLLLAALLACACSGNKAEKPAPRGSAVLAPEPAASSPTTTKPAKGAKPAAGKPAKGAKPAAAPAAIDAGVAGDAKIVEQDELRTEEPEANPHSESVTLKLSVSPPVKALVLYGAKQMAHLEPGKMDAEITRPRGSGPLDLDIKAEGYLPHHTRLYADRNDRLSVRLYRPEEAPNLFGYKRSVEGRKAEAEKAEKLEKAEKAEKAK